MIQSSRSALNLLLLVACAFLIPSTASSVQPDPRTIIAKSVKENQIDFQAAPDFSYKERDSTPNGSKTYQVTMIDGSPYQRLMAVDDHPLSNEAAEQEEKKQQEETKTTTKKEPGFFDNPIVKSMTRTAGNTIVRSLLGALGLGGKSRKSLF